MSDEQHIAFYLFDSERAYIQLAYSWARKQEQKIGTDILLTKENVFWFLVDPCRSYVVGHDFLGGPSILQRFKQPLKGSLGSAPKRFCLKGWMAPSKPRRLEVI